MTSDAFEREDVLATDSRGTWLAALLALVPTSIAAAQHHPSPWSYGLAAAGVLTAVWSLYRRPRCYQAGPHGLTMHYLLRRPRHCPWASIEAVERDANQVVFRTQGGPVRARSTVPGILDVATRTEAGLREFRFGASGPSLEPDDLPAALGLVGDQVVFVPPAWKSFPGIGAPTALIGTLICALVQGPWYLRLGFWLLTLLVALTCWLVIDVSLTRVIADGNGLTVDVQGQRRQIRWSDLRQVAQRPDCALRTWQVIHTDGWFEVVATQPNVERLVELCQRAVDLHARGVRLPSTEPVPEGALSRATGDTSDAERGISRADA